MSAHVVGTANTILLIEGIAVISSIHVRICDSDNSKRLITPGQVGIESSIAEHYRTTILDAIDKITGSLGIEKKCYEISIRNIEAASVKGLNIALQGYSADLSIFLALLSAGLNLPIPQDIAITGRLISADGYVGPVSGLPEKIYAASVTSNIRRMLFPDFNKDKSVDALTPKESDRITRAIVDTNKSLKIEKIGDLSDLTRLVFSDDLICKSSLKEGYYGILDNENIGSNPVNSVILYLGHGNDKRFWNTLEQCFFNEDFDSVRRLTHEYSDFHIRKKTYPQDFGEQLLKVVNSLPPGIKKHSDFLPVLSFKDYKTLIQYADDSNGSDDFNKLHKAAFETKSYTSHTDAPGNESSKNPTADITLQSLLTELSPENIAKEVLVPIDNARASYTINCITVDTYYEFLDYLSCFHAHMLRYCGKISGNINHKHVLQDALALIPQSVFGNEPEKGAYAEATSGTRGGLRFVFDVMTSAYKAEVQRDYIDMVIKTAIDPLSFDTKTNVIMALLNQVNSFLPEEIRNIPPEMFTERFNEIIKAYSKSTEQLIEKMRLI